MILAWGQQKKVFKSVQIVINIVENETENESEPYILKLTQM